MSSLRSIWFCIIGLLALSLVFADEIDVEMREEDIDLALLEFLGTWETDEGEWIAPEELEDSAYEIAQNETVVTNNE